jgi:O-methyltransferase
LGQEHRLSDRSKIHLGLYPRDEFGSPGREPGRLANVRYPLARSGDGLVHGSRLDGDFVECGVNTGWHSLAICEYVDFNSLDKAFYLFDTYCGLPEEQMSPYEKEHKSGFNKQYYPECYELTRRNFAPWPRVKLVRGKVPDTLTSVAIERVAYLSLDMNLAHPERAALEHFWPKLTPGALVVLDDYAWICMEEQKEAADQFAKARGVEVLTLPTGQGLLIKS